MSSWSSPITRWSPGRWPWAGQSTVRPIIDKGLKPGETVVTDGQLRLVPGAKVEVKAGAASGPGKAAHEHRRALHPPAGHDHPGHAGHPPLRHRAPTGCLPVSDLPNVDFPTIQVTANLPGASPETMASAVATPLEKQFSTIAGLDSMTSTSALG